MTVSTSDHWIVTDKGKLFAGKWLPSNTRHLQPPIILFHDSLGCIDTWRDFPRRLAAATHRAVVAYDRLGFGRSDPYPGPLPPTFIADEASVVLQLCDSLRLGNIVPFGHSVGGLIAVATATRLPDRSIAVVSESAPIFVEDVTLSGLNAARERFTRPHQFDRLVKYHGERARWVLDAWIETWLSPAFAGWSLDDELRNLDCPTLALHGDRDEYGSVKQLERVIQMTHAPLRAVVLEGCGHIPHREQPARVLHEVRDFLAQPAGGFS